jgi:hypothetical protein
LGLFDEPRHCVIQIGKVSRANATRFFLRDKFL